MKRSTMIILTTVALATIVAGASVHAKRGEHRAEHIVEFIIERLALDGPQSEALRTLRREIAESRAMLHGESESLHSELDALMVSTPFDQGQALALIDDRITALQATAPDVVAAAGAFLDGLSDSQREALQSLMQGAMHRGGHAPHRHWHTD